MKRSESIDAYIAAAPAKTRPFLRQLRTTIQRAAPAAEETISYGIPTYRLGRNLVHFGAFKDHISFFPTSSGITAFAKDLAGFSTSRGTIRLPLDRPLPLPLIRKIVAFRVKEETR
ncbi:MAG TPA: DUF1801 domain-containing protein [Opitutaceae bacterium]|nr:DUF1801 domain-containing protein [Opitutaceae bacterium]